MARPRQIDREQVLNAAEGLVATEGTAALTFGRIAAVSGLPKASIQSAFGTREKLIGAMLDRWLATERDRFEAYSGPDPSPGARIIAHLRSSEAGALDTNRRMAALLAALTESGHASPGLAAWYASRIGDFSADTPQARRLRLVFLAAEGALYIRHLAGVPIAEKIWRDLFMELEQLARDAEETHRRPTG